MISEIPAIVQVQAIYSFKGKNNDEVMGCEKYILIQTHSWSYTCDIPFFQLNFKKGDIITITQKEEGGWWEGTLDGKTGWFPSNYVKDIAPPGIKHVMHNNLALIYQVLSKKASLIWGWVRQLQNYRLSIETLS